jgi:DNA polymerase-3 subunit alpha
MGKKIAAMLADLKPKFIEGGKKNGHDEKILLKIWGDWEKFASYAFNKSHAACYAWVAYQTGYLKAHYPAEYMAANLTRNKDSIDDVKKFMEECKAMKIEVKGPDINESDLDFSVTKNNGIRFGLGGIKGVGEAAVEGIVAEREKNGAYKDIYDFVERVNLSQVNRRTIESLAIAGAFDSFKDLKRSQFLEPVEGDIISFSEALGKYGQKMKSGGNTGGSSLFGDTVQVEVKKPMPKNCEEWSDLIRLNKEKELVGIYLSAHPLDQYKLEITNYCNATMAEMSSNDDSLKTKNEIKLAGIVTAAAERTTKTGNPWGQLTVEDFSGSYQFAMFSKDYMQYKSFFTTGYAILIKGKMQPRYNNPAEMDFRITSIEFLSDMKDKMLSSITLSLPVNEIDDKVVKMLQRISTTYKGNSTLALNIFDPKTKVKIQMHSRTRRVKIDSALISELSDQNISYEIR